MDENEFGPLSCTCQNEGMNRRNDKTKDKDVSRLDIERYIGISDKRIKNSQGRKSEGCWDEECKKTEIEFRAAEFGKGEGELQESEKGIQMTNKQKEKRRKRQFWKYKRWIRVKQGSEKQ